MAPAVGCGVEEEGKEEEAEEEGLRGRVKSPWGSHGDAISWPARVRVTQAH